MSLTWRMAPVHQTTSLLFLLLLLHFHRFRLQTRVVTSWPAASAAGPSPSLTSSRSFSTNRAAAALETKPLMPLPHPPPLPTEHSSSPPTPSWGRASSSWGGGWLWTESGGRSSAWGRRTAKQVSEEEAEKEGRLLISDSVFCCLWLFFFQPTSSSFTNWPPSLSSPAH